LIINLTYPVFAACLVFFCNIVINLLSVNFVALQIFYPDLIDKTKTPLYTLVSFAVLNAWIPV